MEYSTWAWVGPTVGILVGGLVAGTIQIMTAGQRLRSKDREELSKEWQALFDRQQQDIDRLDARFFQEQVRRHDCEIHIERLTASVRALQEALQRAGISVSSQEPAK